MRSKKVVVSLSAVGVLAVLALGLLWGTLAGAATALSDGVVTTDREFVSTDRATTNSGDRTVAVTLTNLGLNTPEYVGSGPDGQTTDFDLDGDGATDGNDVVIVTLNQFVFQNATFTVRLDDALEPEGILYTIAAIAGDLITGDIVPLVASDGISAPAGSDIRIVPKDDGIVRADAAAAGVDIGPDEVAVASIVDATAGRIQFRAVTDIGAGETFGIRFVTSPQESALVNVKGDSGNFDLLLVENAAGPAGEYDGSYVVSDSIVIDMGLAPDTSALNTITHEQHDVPAALRGNVLFDDEVHTATVDISTGGATFDITVDNPPIREDTRVPAVTDEPTGVDLLVTVEDAKTGLVRITYLGTSTNTLAAEDEFGITYRGSDSFSFNVDFAPIAGDLGDFIVPSDKDTPLIASGDVFEVISVNNATGEVRVGVIVGVDDDDDGEGQGVAALSSHITVIGVSYAGSETVEVPAGGVAVGTSFTAVVEFPVEDATANGTADAFDVEIISLAGLTAGSATIMAVDGSSITFTSAGPADLVAGDSFTIAYAFSAGSDPRNALLPAQTDRPIILVGPGSRSTVASGNDKITVDGEADPPEFENEVPSDGAATTDIAATLSIDITDALAGVDSDSVVFVVSDDNGNAATELVDANRFGDDTDETVSISTDGDVVTASVALDDVDTALTSLAIDSDGTTTVWWWVEASDNASNAGTTDAVADDDADATTVDNQAFVLRVDTEDPELESVFVGDVWNPDTEQIEGDRRLGVGQFLPGSSDPSVVRVKFNEDLSGPPAVSAFSVTNGDGNALTITRVDWFDADDATSGASVRDSVFLVLSATLDAGAVVTVQVVGTVSDAGGNTITTSDATDADDGIAPTATVSVDTTLSTGEVAVTVTTDEGIRTLEPELGLFVSTSDDPDTAVTFDAKTIGVNVPRAVRTPGENVWTFTLNIATANTYSIVVAAEDAERNRGETGVENRVGADDPITFEIDNALPGGAGEIPGEAGTATEGEPFFIEINWLSEAGEYIGDSQDSVDLVKAVLDEGTDDERDLIAEAAASTRDGRQWTLAVSNVGLGEHTLTYNGEDALGNTRDPDETLTFTVVERPTFDVILTPGTNLVSIPGKPATTSIDGVFGEFEAVDLIFTRDGDRWLVALRNPTTGAFEGTLSTIDAKHAYWVRASATTTVSVEIPSQGVQDLPPSIDVMGGQWNLVPVISLIPLEKLTAGVSTLDADAYFGTNWSRAFTFDRGQWEAIVPSGGTADRVCENLEQGIPDGTIDGDANEGACGQEDGLNPGEFFTGDLLQAGGNDGVQIGRGYWVRFTEDETIVP